MLTDQAEIPTDVEVAFVDGIVRLREDEEKLIEARRRSRYLVAWGTCSALGGIPTHANRFEIEELIEGIYGRAEKLVPQPKPVVCGECGRKVTKAALSSLRPFPAPGCDSVCFNSQGIPCLGFVVRGGCEGACPRNGLPCRGCRGPSKLAIKRTAEGDTLER